MVKTFTVRLTGDIEREFNAIKTKLGLKADVEAVRHVIHKTALQEGIASC